MPIKGRSRALVREGWPRGRTGWRTVSLSLSHSPSRTLVTPYCKRTRPGRRATRRPRVSPFAVSPPFVLRIAPTHLGWDTRRQFTRRSRDPPGSKRRHGATNIGMDTRCCFNSWKACSASLVQEKGTTFCSSLKKGSALSANLEMKRLRAASDPMSFWTSLTWAGGGGGGS
jgi:hypothetical protein